MVLLALFGWFVIVVFTAYLTFVSVVGTWACMAFYNKIEWGMWVAYIITLGMWVLAVKTCPLTIALN